MNRWLDQAACRGADTRVFFPGLGEASEPAIKKCSVCPVRAECLLDAVECDDWSGVRGGWSGRRRRDHRGLLRRLSSASALDETRHLLGMNRTELELVRAREVA